MTSPNRPPRKKRPPEVKRHVGETIDAYRRMQEARKAAAARPSRVRPAEKP